MFSSRPIQQKVIKGSMTVLALALLGSIFAYLVRILFSRTLSIESYGLFYAVFGLFNIAATYVDLGLGYAIVYFLPKYIKSQNYSKAWSIFAYGQLITLSASIAFSLVLILLAPFLSRSYFKVPGSEVLIYILCIYLISFTVIYSLTQVFGGMQKERYYSSIAFIRWFITLIFSSIFLVFGFSNVIYYAIALSAAHILTALVYLFLLFHKHKFLSNNRVSWDKPTLKEMFSKSLPVLLETIVYSLVVLGDNFFLTMFKGVGEVGVYNIIYPLASIPIMLINPLTTLILPLVSHLMEKEKNQLQYLIDKLLQVIPFVGLYFGLFIVIFPSSTVRLIFGQKWTGLVEIPLTVLSIGAIAMLTSIILGAVTLGIGEAKKKLKATLFASLINISLNVLLISYYGALGAAITTSLFALILCFFFIKIIKRVIEVHIPYLLYLKFAAFSIVVYFSVRYTNIQIQSWIELMIFGILYTIFYITFGYRLKLYNKQLLDIVLSGKVA